MSLNAERRFFHIRPLLAFAIPFAVYLATLAPSVTFFDSGEFMTAIYSLGTAHSPGYPFFINVVKPFTWLPFGSIAFRINIATAFTASLATLMAYILTEHLLAHEERPATLPGITVVRRLIPLAVALAFAFTPRLWLQSNHDKPYPLLAFNVALVFYLLLRFRERYQQGEEEPRLVYLSAFLCGLATGAHQTIVLMLPAFAWLILSLDWRLIRRVKEFSIATAFGLLGFAIHLHGPVRALRAPLLNWGDPQTLGQFLWNLLRKGYPVEKPYRDLALLGEQLNAFNIPYEFGLVGLLLLFAALIFFWRRRRDELIAFLIAVATFLLIIVGYFNTPAELIFLTEEFFTPLYLLSAVLMGLGLFAVHCYLAEILSPRFRSVAMGFSLALIIAFPFSQLLRNYHTNDQHANYVALDYATNTLRSLPPGAVLFTWGDSGAFPLWYLQGVERMREDVLLLHTPHLVFDWYLDSFPGVFDRSMLRSVPYEQRYAENLLSLAIYEMNGQRPMYVDFSTRYSVQFANFGLQQRGIIYGLLPGSPQLVAPQGEVWNLYNWRGITGTEMGFSDLDTQKAILIYASARLEAGETLYRLGRKGEGMTELQQAVTIAPTQEVRGQAADILSRYGAP